MSQMETAVHVGIGHTGHVLGICFMEILRIGMFLDSGSVDFECLFALPEATRLVFKGTEGITFSCLWSNIGFSAVCRCCVFVLIVSTLGASAAMLEFKN